MAIIKVMDTILANKIAAGEVVERCASVVKELVENSIDADSTEIKVELIESGIKQIKVTDNGKGMDREDAINCFSRHATSKIIDEDMLNEAIAFDEIYKQQNRKTCVILPYVGIKKILEKYDL